MSCRIVDTPIGPIAITASEGVLGSITILTAPGADSGDDADDPVLDEAATQLNAYFAGSLKNFDLPLAPASTPRGEALRAAIAAIPYGQVASYGELARKATSGPRAIGQACKRNPFPIVIPCHRVIGTGGTIGHYSGGEGIPTKRILLHHENREDPQIWAA